MKLTDTQYRDMSQCLGKDINKDTDFEMLSLELQKDIHEIVETLRGLISMNKSLLKDNGQLIEQNEYLLGRVGAEDILPPANRILN